MEEFKRSVTEDVQGFIKTIDRDIQKKLKQVERLKTEIESLHTEKGKYLNFLSTIPNLIKKNQPLTKEYIREFMKKAEKPVQTVDVIDILYDSISDEEKTRLIKNLSVIFNKLVRDKVVSVEKVAGLKGNRYKWISTK